jgi:2,4-dienoyl-CoA reductase-like NADH-dependent reductase (Old Yellow Enzyme family)/thioredoxin reductase
MKLLSPLRIGTLEIKNRMVSGPMVMDWADREGNVTRRMIDSYAERAAGGWGLVNVEATYIRPDGCNFRYMLGLWNDRQVAGHNELAEAIRLAGSKCILQIMHGGRAARSVATGVQPVSASSRRPWGGVNPRELSTEEVEELVKLYGIAAGWTKEAGYNGVLIHGAHGFLITQFLDPFTNNRRDKYGELVRFPIEIVQAVRAAVGPDYPVLMRLNGDNFMGDISITLDLAKEQAKALEAAGVDGLDVSAGIFEAGWHQIQPPYYKRGYLVHLAEGIKKVVNIPVGISGRINDPTVATGIIEDGRADWVQMGRQCLADPDFPKKVAEGRFDDIRKCIACGEGCLKRLIFNVPGTCAINPRLGREWRYRMTPTASKKVLVVGGGLVGMEAARVAAERGFKVTLYEKDNKLGGTMALYAGMSKLYMREFINPVDWLTRQLKNLGVDVKLGNEATAQTVGAAKADAVVLATGATPFKPDIPGIDKPFVFTDDDYLAGKAKLGSKVVMLGGKWGAEIAVSLAREDGVELTLVEESDDVGSVLDAFRQIVIKGYLADAKVTVMTGQKAIAITDEGVRVMDKNWKVTDIPANIVVVSMGRVANEKLAKALEGKVAELYKIGDCNRPNEWPILLGMEEANFVALRL